jgi:predicted acyltransferase
MIVARFHSLPQVAMSSLDVTPRLVSLDQFRGYTVLGMFLVNFVGGMAAVPAILKHHHTYLSYADTIMPQFFVAVGFAYRLTWLRRRETDGLRFAALRTIRRNLGLILLGLVIYHLDGKAESWAKLVELGPWGVLTQGFQRNPFQTLTHIGVTALWVLPVIGASAGWRVAFMIASAGLHVWLSHAGYYDWVMNRPGIDGGPLGFLTWTVPMLVGSLACDLVLRNMDGGRGAGKLFAWGIALALLGYGLACLNRVTPPNALPESWAIADLSVEPPFVPPSQPINIWTMSQRAGSVSYLVCSTGLALMLLAVFRVACDAWRWRSRYLELLGQHALAGYIIHELVSGLVKPYTPRDAPLAYLGLMFAVYLGIVSLFLRHLDRHKLFLRL